MSRGAPRYSIVLAIRRFSARQDDLHLLLRPLNARLGETLLLAADAYHRTQTDIALLVLHVDTRFVTGPLLATIQRDVQRTGASMFEMDKMNGEDRARFIDKYLPGQDVQLRDLPTMDDAVRLLAERLGMQLHDAGRHRSDIDPPSVRFRRGHDWERGRLCRLTSEGLYIATGGPPRVGDRAEIEVIGPKGSVVMGAAVVQVTPPHAAEALGAAGFAARFKFKDAAEQRALAPALAAARDAVVHLAPPPRRRHTRFPMRWPGFLAQGTGTTSIRVLDVSEGGLFLETTLPTESPWVNVLLPYDERGAPLRLGARVARKVTRGMRGCRGLNGGIGVELVQIQNNDDARYQGFVDRVARRAQLRIVIGAGARRLEPLMHELSSSGYLVTGASVPRVVFDRVVECADPPELVVVDETIEDGNIRAARSLHRALTSRAINTLRVDQEPPAGVRHLIDAALVAN